MTASDVRSAHDSFLSAVSRPGAVNEIAGFCKVTPGTVTSWQNGTWPRGEPMYRLWVYLELSGFPIVELKGLPAPSYRLALLLGCGIVSFDDAREELGYTNLNSVFRLIRNESGPSSDKFLRLEKLLSAYGPPLDEFLADFKPVSARTDDDIVRSVLDSERQQGTQPIDEPQRGNPVAQAPPLPNPPTPVVASDTDPIELTVRLLKQFVRRADRVDSIALADKVKQEIPAHEVEKVALLLLEIV